MDTPTEATEQETGTSQYTTTGLANHVTTHHVAGRLATLG